LKLKAAALSLMLFFHFNINAQELPPIPPTLPQANPPREPTPEELAAQRKAREARWRADLERFVPFAHQAKVASKMDAPTRQRLLSAEALVREEKERR